MDISKIYDQIISDLKNDKRALIKLSEPEISELLNQWEKGLSSKDLEQVLCLLDHMIDYSLRFEPFLCEELKKVESSITLIFLLGASQKHIIAAAAKDGYPPSSKFMKILKEKFESSYVNDPETFEWLLRTVEQTGMKSLLFKEVILKNKPGLGSLFNNHKKACKEIIEFLEKRWAPVKGGPIG